MIIDSKLCVSKTSEMDGMMTTIWNNLIGAMSIVNSVEPPGRIIYVNNPYLALSYTVGGLGLSFGNSFGHANITFRCNSSLVNDLGAASEIVAMTTSALEYVIGREDCLGIEEWYLSFDGHEYKYQDVGVGSIAEMMGINKECAIDLLEKHVEPKLDEIEQLCL